MTATSTSCVEMDPRPKEFGLRSRSGIASERILKTALLLWDTSHTSFHGKGSNQRIVTRLYATESLHQHQLLYRNEGPRGCCVIAGLDSRNIETPIATAARQNGSSDFRM